MSDYVRRSAPPLEYPYAPTPRAQIFSCPDIDAWVHLQINQNWRTEIQAILSHLTVHQAYAIRNKMWAQILREWVSAFWFLLLLGYLFSTLPHIFCKWSPPHQEGDVNLNLRASQWADRCIVHGITSQRGQGNKAADLTPLQLNHKTCQKHYLLSHSYDVKAKTPCLAIRASCFPAWFYQRHQVPFFNLLREGKWKVWSELALSCVAGRETSESTNQPPA